jgi:Arc/MetJ family transcription regulator
MVSKHLVDIDEAALTAARAVLGTDTIKDTVNAALRQAGRSRQDRVRHALAVLAGAKLADRTAAWR